MKFLAPLFFAIVGIGLFIHYVFSAINGVISGLELSYFITPILFLILAFVLYKDEKNETKMTQRLP